MKETTLGEVAEYLNGRAFKPTEWEDNGLPIIRIQNLNNPEVSFNYTSKIYEDKYLVQNGDLLFAWSASLGAHIWKGEDGWLNQHIFKVKPYSQTNKIYLYYYLLLIVDELYAKTHGSGMVHINLKPFKATPIYLPSLAEQKRIVERIESLLSKLDRAKELAKNALDFFENRKSAILHKAFTGKLTAKWREDNKNTKYDTLKNIETQRLVLCKSQNDRTNILNEFTKCISDSEVQDSWIYLKALLICDFITKGETPTKSVSNKGEIPFLKVYNIRDNKLDFTYEPSFIPRNIHEQKMKRSKVYPEDIIMNIVGPPLQKVAIVPNEYAEWNINQAIAIFRPVEEVLTQYLYYCLLCDDTLKTVLADTRGVVGQSNISLEQCRNLIIPVPPLKEQQEIVRILDSLLENEQKAKELCDVIDKIELMKKSILARAFHGELSTNNPDE